MLLFQGYILMFSHLAFYLSAQINKGFLNKDIEDIVVENRRIYVVSVYTVYDILQECSISLHLTLHSNATRFETAFIVWTKDLSGTESAVLMVGSP